MAKSVAERQAEYRKRRSNAGDNGERRINTWVNTSTSLALSRLANRYAVTQRQILEKLIMEADKKILDSLDIDSEDWKIYFFHNSVTQ